MYRWHHWCSGCVQVSDLSNRSPRVQRCRFSQDADQKPVSIPRVAGWGLKSPQVTYKSVSGQMNPAGDTDEDTGTFTDTSNSITVDTVEDSNDAQLSASHKYNGESRRAHVWSLHPIDWSCEHCPFTCCCLQYFTVKGLFHAHICPRDHTVYDRWGQLTLIIIIINY